MISATTNYLNALAAYRSGKLIYAIEITGYSRVLTNYADGISGHYDWLLESGVDDYSYTVNELDGGADVGQLSFHVQDQGGAITGDFPGFVFEGKQVVLKQGFVGLAYSDYVTLFTGFVDTVDSENDNTSYVFTCSDVSARLSQVIYEAGDDGQPTSGDHKKTIVGHPLDILLDILGTQLGLSSSYYDSTTIQAYRDGPFSGMKFVFHLDQAQAAADFMKAQLLKPLGGYYFVTGAGKITVKFNYPLNTITAADSISNADWLTIPGAEQLELINQVQFKFDKNDSDSSGSSTNSSYLATAVEEYAASISRYGQYGEHVVESDGIRSAFQGFFLANFIARLIFFRYGLKLLKFDQNAAESIWGKVLLEPGDIVAVTHPHVPDRAAGVLGISNKLFEVLNKSINFTEGRVTLVLVDASYLTNNFGYFLITPNGEADYAAASSGDKAKYMFMTNDSGVYSNSDGGHGLG